MTTASVNAALTAYGQTAEPPARLHRRRAVVENDDFAAFARRVVAAHGRRIASGDIEGLAALAALAQHVDGALADAVAGLRAAGFSWAEIADRLNVTRQAAHQRFTGDIAVRAGVRR